MVTYLPVEDEHMEIHYTILSFWYMFDIFL